MIFWILGTVVVLSILSATPEGRAAARARLSRYNPIFIGVDIVLFYCLYQILFGPRIN